MNKTWNTNLIGVLASEESVHHALGKRAIFKNTQNMMQFYVRIISKVPYSFSHIRLVTFFGSDLENWGFEGNDYEESDGIKAVKNFLQDNLILFKPERKVMYDHTEFYDGKDFTLLPKSEGYHEGVHLTPLPVFSEEVHGITKAEFEERLQTQSFVGRIDSISSEQKDTPEYVLWKNGETDYYVYGEFSGHHYTDEGFSFTTNRQIKSALFQEEWLDECYEYENTLFVPYEVYTYINGTISAAEALKINYGDKRQEFMEKLESESSPGIPSFFENHYNRAEMTEEELMTEFIQTTKKNGLLYDEKDLYNFHTAMKSSNLVILSGMSGTGKSKLVQAYGETLGLFDDYQMTFIPVRPSWTDDADVIGYADTLENVYRPGDSGVINALLSAQQNKNMLHIICFDEMNLARVEHYFSQFLSVLEMEAGSSKVLRLYNDGLKERLNNSDLYPPVIPIGDNVIFIGTVNLDESTYHFSDKVLDRANVITLSVLPFESLKLLTREEQKNSAGQAVRKTEGTVSFELFDSYRNRNRDIFMSESELALLWEIHTELQKVNKNLGAGPRIVRQIDLYLKNLPRTSKYTREEAFDKQVVQRILTKVRGPEEQLKDFIGMYDKQAEDIEESKLGEILDKYHDVSAFYETRNVLIHKAKELKNNGYTL